MREFILSSETACDLTQEQIEQFSLSILPMNFYVDGNEYNSKDSPLSTKDLCDKMKKGSTTKTSQPNEMEIETYLTSLLLQGKDVLHLSFSSAMSGTCNSFKTVAERLNKSHDNKIYVVDTLCQSAGLGLLLIMTAKEIQEKQLSVAEARDYAENLKLQINHYFIVEDLKYLARGGRISPTLATIGNLLKLKPVLYLDNTGKITQLQKVLGRKKALASLKDKIFNNFNHTHNEMIICHADAEDDAELVKSAILERFPDVVVSINPLGPVITSHSGPGTLAVFLTTNKRI